MSILADVELCTVPVDPAASDRTVPGACATCRKCGHTATVIREQLATSQYDRRKAAGYEKLPALLKRAALALADECPRTTGESPVQSFPNKYEVATIPASLRLVVAVRDVWAEATLRGRTLATTAGAIDRGSSVWVQYTDRDHKPAAKSAALFLTGLGYAAEICFADPTDDTAWRPPDEPACESAAAAPTPPPAHGQPSPRSSDLTPSLF